MTLSSNIFDGILFLLSTLVTGPSFMSVSSLVLELWHFSVIRVDQKSRNRNAPVWTLPNIWRMRRVRDTIFGTNVCNKMLLNAAKCQVYSFYRFWVIKRKPTRGGEGAVIPSPLPRLGLRKQLTINKISEKIPRQLDKCKIKISLFREENLKNTNEILPNKSKPRHKNLKSTFHFKMLWNHSFSTNAKCSEKLTFLTYVCILSG